MGWEQRKGSGRRYYFRSERRAGKVVKTYLGSHADPLAKWIARADCLTRAIAQSERVADHAGISPDSDESVATFCRIVRAVERSLARRFAMHGNMHREPSMSGRPGADANTLPSQGEFGALALRADRGNGAAQAEVRRLLDRHPDLWKSLGDLGQLVEERLIDVMTERSFALREAVCRYLRDQAQSLTRFGGNPLECLLIQRVLVSWLELQIRQLDVTQVSAVRKERTLQRRLDQAQKRHLEAVLALESFQKH